MYNTDELAKVLLEHVNAGELTAETAEAICSAAEAKNALLEESTNNETETEEEPVVEEQTTPSTCDQINAFLEERIQEACSECDPTKNVKDEITEKLPTVTPNESDVPADDPSIEKTDKAIEDVKKDLDVAGKLAEMKAKHEAEKDTTQQHEVIKQVTESVKEAKLNIYEAFDAGHINADEKDELLALLEE